MMKTFYKDKSILVTGGCGSIGSEIVRQLIELKPKKIIVFDQNESAQFHLVEKLGDCGILVPFIGSVRDKERLQRALKGVDVVFHAAALKHVPLSEYNPAEAVKTNVIGTLNLIDAAQENGVERVISISTDKAVHPINTMGATKLLSEKLITDAAAQSKKTLFCSVRFGNVLNSDGSVIQIFNRQIQNGGPVTVTSKDMTRFFMFMEDAVNLVLEASLKTKGGEIFILDMKSVKIIDLAEVMIELLAPKYGYGPKDIKMRIIGQRPGEKIYESLFTSEEMPFITKDDRMFVLRPMMQAPNPAILSEIMKYGKPGNIEFTEYSSNNVPLLSKDEIRECIKKLNL